MIARMRSAGRVTEADRLESEGRAGYPGDTEHAAVAAMLCGQVIVQIGDLQVASGSGPLRVHLRYTMVADPQGSVSPHYELIQSWLPVQSDLNSAAPELSNITGPIGIDAENESEDEEPRPVPPKPANAP